MKKWAFKIASLVLAGALIFTVGCAAQTAATKTQQTNADPFAVKVALTDSKEDDIQVKTAIPEFSGFQAAGELNAKIKSVSLDGIAQLKQATKDLGDTAGSYSLYYSSFFDYTRNNDVLSVWITSENYSGGAHGTHWITAFTLNTKTGEFYSPISSLFQDAKASEKQITDHILNEINVQKDIFFPEAAQAVKDKKGNYSYYLDGDSLVVYYDLYELIPYAGGIPTFKFPIKDLALKPALTAQKPLGANRLNGTDILFKNPVYSDSNGVYLPLEETAALLGHTVTSTDGKYTVDGMSVQIKKVTGKIYAPLMFFTGTLGDFVVFDGTVLRMFTQTGPGLLKEKLAGSVSSGVESEEMPVSSIVSQPADNTISSPADENTEEILTYIKKFDAAGGQIIYDPIEWVVKDDAARIKELGLDADVDFPNGFHIYNPSEETETLKLSPNAAFDIVYWNNEMVEDGHMAVNREKFMQRLQQPGASEHPFHLTVKDGVIIKVQEQYIP